MTDVLEITQAGETVALTVETSPQVIEVITAGPAGPAGDTGPEGPAGASGDPGPAGSDGWSPVFVNASDGERRVLQVTDWTGGTGTKPAINLYVGATGLVANIADGVDVRGASGSGTGDLLAANNLSDVTNAATALSNLGGAASSHTHAGVYEPANANIQSHIGSTANPHSVTKAQVGLGSADNTSDLNKPISTATQSALAGKIDTSREGVANGIATLDASGLVPTGQLPSFVDDVLEYTDYASFPVTGEAGKIYVALDTNKTYRWSGSAYIYITSGAVDSVAGKTGVVTLVKGDVGLGSVDNTSDANKPISTATQSALDGKEPSIGAKGTAFNKSFGATAGTVSEGDHNHDGAYEPADADILKADTTDELTVGFTTTVEVLGSDTITPSFATQAIKTRTCAGNVTINAASSKGTCFIEFDPSGSDRSVTAGANVTILDGFTTMTAGTKYLAFVISTDGTNTTVMFKANA